MDKVSKHKSRLLSIAFVFIVGAMLIFGFYAFNYAFSDKPQIERGIADAQKAAENTRIFFQKYLNYEKPQNIERVDAFARETFKEDFIESGTINDKYYVDVIRETSKASGGIANTTFTFIMCIRLSGGIDSDASIKDISCEKRDNAQRSNNKIPAMLTDRPSLLYVPYHKLFYPKAEL